MSLIVDKFHTKYPKQLGLDKNFNGKIFVDKSSGFEDIVYVVFTDNTVLIITINDSGMCHQETVSTLEEALNITKNWC